MIGRLGESSISGFKRHVSFILSLSLFFSLLLWKELKPSWLEIPAKIPFPLLSFKAYLSAQIPPCITHRA